jgi:hypothetical protein
MIVMDSDLRIFEIIMLICFGSSWPFAVAKTLRTKVVKGKSPVFLALILIGYIAGIMNKLVVDFDHVLWLYCLNGSMVLAEIILYIRYGKVDFTIQFQKIINYINDRCSWRKGLALQRIATSIWKNGN